MSKWRDQDGMRRLGFDLDTADRLLGGSVDPADAPAGLEGVAALVRSAGGTAAAAERTSNPQLVAAIAGAVLESAGVARARSRIAPRAAAVAAAFTLLTGTAAAAAAANGSLPGPAQHTIASVVDHVGVSVPDPGHGAGKGKGHKDTGGTSGTSSSDQGGNGVGPDANGPAKAGLCQAFGSVPAGSPQVHSTAARNLAAAAAADRQSVSAFCATTTTTAAPGTPTTTEAPDAHGKSDSAKGHGDEGTDGEGEDHATTTTAAPGPTTTEAPSKGKGNAPATSNAGGQSGAHANPNNKGH